MSRFTLHEWIQQIETEIAASKVHNHFFRKEIANGIVSGIKIEMIEKGIQKLEWLKELQRYKDLEEQCRLIELPCKVGDTVYLISNKCIEESCPEGMAWECDECDYEEQFLVAEREFKLDMIPKMEKNYYYLTKEEAEARLAELKGGGSDGNV